MAKQHHQLIVGPIAGSIKTLGEFEIVAAGTLEKIRIKSDTVAQGTVVFDILVNNVSIYPVFANRPTITVGLQSITHIGLTVPVVVGDKVIVKLVTIGSFQSIGSKLYATITVEDGQAVQGPTGPAGPTGATGATGAAGSGGATTLAGDVTGASGANTVEKVRGRAVGTMPFPVPLVDTFTGTVIDVAKWTNSGFTQNNELFVPDGASDRILTSIDSFSIPDGAYLSVQCSRVYIWNNGGIEGLRLRLYKNATTWYEIECNWVTGANSAGTEIDGNIRLRVQRDSTATVIATQNGTTGTITPYVRILRAGTTLTAQWSIDGVTWNSITGSAYSASWIGDSDLKMVLFGRDNGTSTLQMDNFGSTLGSPDAVVPKSILEWDAGLQKFAAVGQIYDFAVAGSDEITVLTTGTAKLVFHVQRAFTLVDIWAGLSVVSSSGLPTINVKKNGVTIFTTKITIDASEFTSLTAATAKVLTAVTSFIKGDKVEIDIDVAGTGAKGLKVYFEGTRI